jgi:starch synthase
VLFVTAEIFPLAKTGGLGDVCAALPAVLAELGVDVRLMMPAYPQALDTTVRKRLVAELPELLGGPPSRIISALTPDSHLPLFLFDCPPLYQRDGDPYQDSDGRDWPDNAQRFALLSRAAADLALGAVLPDWQADVVHCNDWHTGLLPAYLSLLGGHRPATLFTIHNLAFQGLFSAETFSSLGLPSGVFSPDGVECYGKVSFLKAGIRYSDKLTTVSPTYAQEILTPALGCGLDGLLRARAADLVGILNGIDERVWSPVNDCHLPEPYDAEHLERKQASKAHVRDELHLVDDERPLIGILNRLTRQKMADTVASNVHKITAQGAQVALVGTGDKEIEAAFLSAANDYPGRVAVRIGYQEPLAHRLFAGADLVLAPARFEPCGLTPIYAMRYGTPPVVRTTGGMADSVIPVNRQTTRAGTATGFAFEGDTGEDMLACLAQALTMYEGSSSWRQIQFRAMKRDFGWRNSACEYVRLYEELVQRVGTSPLPTP